MIILIHTSKTMRPPVATSVDDFDTPQFIAEATELAHHLKTLNERDIRKSMNVSEKLATTTKELIASWTANPKQQRVAIDSFLGDIYSGLQVQDWSRSDREYANEHLRILSGLYGIVKPLDGIFPYRLEMGYKLPAEYRDLYKYWGDKIVKTIPESVPILDLSAVEYGKTVTKYVDLSRVVSPRFLTISPKTGEPTFVVVHAKIARGAFASWMIRHRIENGDQLKEFNELGYFYDKEMSTPNVPVFICKEFGGLGLSVRLS